MQISFLVSLGAALLGVSSPEDELRLPLRVLYASEPGTEYRSEWAKFLAAHTKEVRAVAHDRASAPYVALTSAAIVAKITAERL